LSIHKDIAADFKLAGKNKIRLRIEFSENLNHTPITDIFTIINDNGRAINLRDPLKSWLESLTPQQRQDSFFIVTVLDAPSINLDRMRAELEKRVEELLDDPNLPEPEGVEKPKTRTQNNVSSIERDAEVKAWVIQQANGKCEYCQETGFIKDNGKHYMEVHHLRPLAEHGSDKPRNTVAVCPNCHKKLHFAQCRKKIRTELIQRITRLKDEYL
jgi:predicted HNH restriction endonuclease